MKTKIIRLSATPAGFGEAPDDIEQGMFESELPVQHSHSYFEDDDLGLYVGVWDTTTMTELAGPYPCDEFMCVLGGEVGIRNSKTGDIERVQAGEAFVIPRAYDCQWQQSGYLRKFYVIYEPPAQALPESPAVEGIVKPQLVSGAGLSAPPTGDVSYRDTSGQFCVGSWQAGAFEGESTSKPYHQFIYIVQGCLQVQDESGEVQSFQTEEALFLPQGVVSGWSSHGQLGILSVKVRS